MRSDGNTEKDRALLSEAARLARKGRGQVEPNPMVGALVVKDGAVVAKGYHAHYGGPHAEIHALKKAGPEAVGAALYVTLEPCSTTGKTPPCTEAILQAGVKEVIVGAVDPAPGHNGRGLSLLEEYGLTVRHIDEERCERLVREFRERLALERPYVILKWAMTLDGKIAARDGSSQWISGPKSRRLVHRLRGHADGVMVGWRTVNLDDPRLNCRMRGAPLTPARIILDPRLKVPKTMTLIEEAGLGKDREGFPAGPVWILVHGKEAGHKVARHQKKGAEVILLEASPDDETAFLSAALKTLKTRGIHRLLVEGGGRTFTGLIRARLADQVVVFIAPKIVGGLSAPSPVGGEGFAPMSEALSLHHVTSRRTGPDICLQGFF